MSQNPFTPQELIAFLDEHEIQHQTIEHRPVFTVEESNALRDSFEPGTPGGPGGGHVKNLYLKNKKGQMWLLTMPDDKRLDMKALGTILGSQRLSFGSAERLMENLGIKPGSVTPFSVINDPDHKVTFLLDADLMAFDVLHLHPLINSMTTMISPSVLERFLKLQKRDLRLIEIP